MLGFLLSLGMAVVVAISRLLELNEYRWEVFIKPGCLFLSSLVLWFGNGWLIYHGGYNRVVKSGLLRGCLSIFLAAVVANLVCDHLLLWSVERSYLGADFHVRFKRPLPMFFGSLSQSIMFYFILLFQKLREEKKNSQIEIQELQQAQMEAKIASLKEQLSPHFLFNTLNILAALTKEKEAQDFIQELAKVYRYVLQYKNNDAATLQEELQFLDSYWYVLKMRFEDSVGLHVSVPDVLLCSLIPPLTLQILIENVIKHNVVSAEEPVVVRIYSDSQMITVENNYRPKRIVEYTGEGLKNIGQRYKLLFGRDICVENDGVCFRVMLPIIEPFAGNLS